MPGKALYGVVVGGERTKEMYRFNNNSLVGWIVNYNNEQVGISRCVLPQELRNFFRQHLSTICYQTGSKHSSVPLA